MLIPKTQFDAGKQYLEKNTEYVNKTPKTSYLVERTDCNTKIPETENKIAGINGLVRSATLKTKVKNEILKT